MMESRQAARGFTLIELVIVVLIIAILAMIAIPSYRTYVVRSHRVDAQSALIDLAARQERYFYSNNAYADTLAKLNATSSLGGALYKVGVASASSSAYVLSAEALGAQAKDDKACQSLTLSNVGAQGSTGAKANDPKCWSK